MVTSDSPPFDVGIAFPSLFLIKCYCMFSAGHPSRVGLNGQGMDDFHIFPFLRPIISGNFDNFRCYGDKFKWLSIALKQRYV